MADRIHRMPFQRLLSFLVPQRARAAALTDTSPISGLSFSRVGTCTAAPLRFCIMTRMKRRSNFLKGPSFSRLPQSPWRRQPCFLFAFP
jgi:hypothetical protein